jgi:hypothetical protein
MDDEAAPDLSAFPGLNLQTLRELSFQTGSKAVDYVKAQAHARGFKLSLRDSCKADRIRLLCHRAEYGKGKKNTTKTGCPVRVTILKRNDHYFITIQDGLVHNHPLRPPPEADIPEQVANSIRDLLALGVPNPLIVQFIERQTGHLLSIPDIDVFRTPESEDAMLSETDGLVDMAKDGDICFTREVTFRGQQHRAGLLFITKLERANLARWGDVLWLDGTAFKNDIGWMTWPVTLCDDRKQLASGGVFFTAFENEEAFVWLLRTFNEILGPQLRTVFTDEDSAFVPAMQTFQRDVRRDVAHRVCLFHKRRNFQKHVDAAKVDPQVRDEALRLFDATCRYPTEKEVGEALAKIRLLVPSLSPYLDRQVCPYLALFTEAYRGGALTLGYAATALSESSNNMSRRFIPSRGISLVAIRKGITRAYKVKCLGTAFAIHHEFRRVEFLEREYGLKLQRPICRWIDKISEKAKQCTIVTVPRASNQAEQYFEATIKGHRTWLIKVTGDRVECECDRLNATGLPCAHLVALFRVGGGAFPVGLISRRWIPNFDEVEIPPLPKICLSEMDDVLRFDRRPFRAMKSFRRSRVTKSVRR